MNEEIATYRKEKAVLIFTADLINIQLDSLTMCGGCRKRWNATQLIIDLEEMLRFREIINSFSYVDHVTFVVLRQCSWTITLTRIYFRTGRGFSIVGTVRIALVGCSVIHVLD